jgi:hypothetical protein
MVKPRIAHAEYEALIKQAKLLQRRSSGGKSGKLMIDLARIKIVL